MIQNYFLLLNSDWKQQLDPRKLKYLKNFASADTYFDSHMHGSIEGAVQKLLYAIEVDGWVVSKI